MPRRFSLRPIAKHRWIFRDALAGDDPLTISGNDAHRKAAGLSEATRKSRGKPHRPLAFSVAL